MYSLFLLLLASIPLYSTQPVPVQPPIQQQPVPVQLTVNIQNSSSSNPSVTTHTEQSVVQKMTQTNMNIFMEAAQKAAVHATGLYHQLLATLWQHKWSTVGTCVALLYARITFALLADKQFMEDGNLWSSWYASKSLAELFALPHETLCKELILAIQTRYVNTTNPTDCVTPLSNFLWDINAEEKRLKQCRLHARLVSQFWLQKILPFSYNSEIQADRLLERLAFVRHLFISWAAEYNWQQTAYS
jgi:hypothetical protein